MENEAKKFDKKIYDMEYKRQKQKRVPLDLPLEMFELWKKSAEKARIPMNTFIKNAVNGKIQEMETKEQPSIYYNKAKIQSDEDKALLDELSL